MKRKKPQSADSHLYDKRALTYLKSVLPEHWKYIPVGDEDSQIEYGQDRIVQLATTPFSEFSLTSNGYTLV